MSPWRHGVTLLRKGFRGHNALSQYLTAVVLCAASLVALGQYRPDIGLPGWVPPLLGYLLTALFVALFGIHGLGWLVGRGAWQRLFSVLAKVVRGMVALFTLLGLFAFLNGRLDQGEPRYDTRQVLDLDRHSLRLGSYYRGVSATLRTSDGRKAAIPLQFEEAQRLWGGAPVRVETRAGALGVPWVSGVSLDKAALGWTILQTNPQAAGVWRERMLYLAEQQDFPGALEAAQRYVALTPQGVGAVQDAASYFVWKQRKAEALALYELAYQVRPNVLKQDKPYWVLLAQAGRKDEAVAKLTEALRLHPDRYEPYLYMSEVYWTIGDRVNQLPWMEKALQLAPWLPLQAEIDRIKAISR